MAMLPLDQALEFDPARDEDFFGALPARPAVCRIEPRAAGGQPYLRRTADLRRACRRALGRSEDAETNSAAVSGAQGGAGEKGRGTTKRPRLNLREIAARVRYRLTGSAFEQQLVIYQQARGMFPHSYRERLRLVPPALLKINLAHAYPRCYVAQRPADDGAFYFGPFPSRRAAEEFAKEFLALFKIRRCHIKIRRDPAFPGCIYSEMKMCLAPCYGGCTAEEYAAEVARVSEFLATRGGSLQGELEAEREQATVAEEFERAAAVHKKHEKVTAVARRLPDLPRRIDQLDAVVLQPAVEEGTVAAFRVHRGAIGDPLTVNFRELSTLPRSVETIFREQLEAESAGAESLSSISDDLSLLARWFYSKPREGEIFFREPGGTWPYRRIIRACARILGPQALLPAGPSAPHPPTRPGK